jgi:hypothetical protein
MWLKPLGSVRGSVGDLRRATQVQGSGIGDQGSGTAGMQEMLEGWGLNPDP